MPAPDTPNLIYVSGDHSVATPVSLPVFTAPFQGVNIDYVLTQDFQQTLGAYTPLDLNTPHVDYSDFILVEEGPRSDKGGGRIQWTRKYAKHPATHNQPSSMLYNFIGFLNSSGTTAVNGRVRSQNVVPARIQFDYFKMDKTTGDITDSTGAIVYNGPPGTLPSVTKIPLLQVQYYYAAFIRAIDFNLFTDEIGYDAGEPSGTPTPQLAYPHPPAASAYPTRGVYETWIANGTELVAQASQPSRWFGNFVERQTIYVVAQ